ncbi:MAG TPA: DUF3098 domain-containing protein [Mucilaginibacter sp.]|jgi:hypothetical protein
MAQKSYKPATPVKSTSGARPAVKSTESSSVQFVFDKSNYRLLIISIAIVALGFVLMSGTTDIYSDTKIIIAPLTVLAGFGVGFFAIFKKTSAVK